MSEGRTVTADVLVTLDPGTAFRVFTEEMASWWLPGPINFYDSARAIAVRCEGGVGGRLVEVYDPESGEGLELGRITVWEPGERVVWQSSVDDVITTVRFLAEDGGTRVVVESFVPEGGRDEGGSSWMRVAPSWFGAWTARRGRASAPGLSRLAINLAYVDPVAAARWVTDVIGLEPTLPLPVEDGGDLWIEFRAGSGILILTKRTDDGTAPPAEAHVPWVFVDDLEVHHDHARGAGANIIQGIHKYGYTAYRVEDPEGHEWTIAEALPAMRHIPLAT